MSADLHLHTTASDGTWNGPSLVAAALQRGLRAIAITDHDTTAGIDSVSEAAAGSGLRLIPGIEFSTKLGNDEVHILGLGINPDASELTTLAAATRNERYRRLDRMLVLLNQVGIPLTHADIAAVAGAAAPGRVHVAQAMVDAGFVADINSAFELYLGQGRPAYAPRSLPSPEEAIAAIHNAGGLAFMAHPGLATPSAVAAMLETTIDGLEVRHSHHTPAQNAYYAELAHSHSLLISAGSDCHGPRNGQAILLGSVALHQHELDKLLERIIGC